MSEHENNSVEKKTETTKTSNRRRFIKQGVMIAPVITTVASQPAWGRGMVSISGNLSGNLSRKPETYTANTYDGKSPGYWKNKQDKHNRFVTHASDLDGVTKNTKFSTIFIFSNNDETIFNILWHQGNEGTVVEKFAIVAYLNALTDQPSFPYTPQEIKDFYNSYINPSATGVPHNRRISKELAHTILTNLVHFGEDEDISDYPCNCDVPRG